VRAFNLIHDNVSPRLKTSCRVLTNLAEISTTLAVISSTHLSRPLKTKESSVSPHLHFYLYPILKLKIMNRNVNVFVNVQIQFKCELIINKKSKPRICLYYYCIISFISKHWRLTYFLVRLSLEIMIRIIMFIITNNNNNINFNCS